MKPEPLSRRVRRLRGEETQVSFAKRAGCSQGVLSRIEGGQYDDPKHGRRSRRRSETGISYGLARGLAKAAGVTIAELMDGERAVH